MDNLGEMRQAIQDDLNANDTSTFYNSSLINRAINRSYRKSGALFRWPELEDSKKTGTVNGWEYYEYPVTWQPDSIWKLVIDGIDYGRPLSFNDYLYEKENWSTSDYTRIWSAQWRRIFVYPVPVLTGDNNLIVWGQKTTEKLEEDSDITIFSYSMPECNEAIILEAKAILKGKLDDTNTSAFISGEAKQILSIAWGKIRQNQAKYVRTTPLLNVSDMFK